MPHLGISKGSKQDAVLWEEPNGPLLNVHREADWRMIRATKPELKCPTRGCTVTLVSVDRRGLRHFRNAPGSVDCEHYTARRHDHTTRGGGPMSDEHRWFQHQIVREMGNFGHLRATIEDYRSNADVLIRNLATNRSLVLEIQRWDTDIVKRTEFRRSLGHEVMWLITDSAKLSSEVQRQIFTTRGAFIHVRSAYPPFGILSPWEEGHPSIPCRIEVNGTIAELDSRTGFLRARATPLIKVIMEIIDGKREWAFPGEDIYKNAKGAGRKSGAWVRRIDLVNAQILKSGLNIPLLTETSRLGKFAPPIEGPQPIDDSYRGERS